jgi:NADPH:quinone reductase-like Zn-dependent oxidoreductase
MRGAFVRWRRERQLPLYGCLQHQPRNEELHVKAVRFDSYGAVDVLDVREVDDPVAQAGWVVVAVKVAGINPGEIAIREGLLHDRWPATFPSGEGTDFAGVVHALGDGVEGFAVGDEVLGFTDRRASHAELVAVAESELTRKPPSVSWEVAGSLFVAGMAGWACADAIKAQPGETVVVSAAAGGVGSVASQLARLAGATVIGLAGERNHDWLRAHDIVPVTYGEGQEDRIRAAAPDGVDAFIDLVGSGYVALALDELGVAPARVDTIADTEAIATRGVKGEGNAAGASAAVLAELAGLVVAGKLEVPIEATFPLDQVVAAYEQLAQGHTRGKIVLLP